ncbi:MAG: B-box zinc finger protein [Bryobacteraceae bacterium]
MNCVNHPESAAVAYCRACGKALCENCQRTAHGTIYCEEHVPMQTNTESAPPPGPSSPYASPYAGAPYASAPYAAAVSPPDLSASPGLAFLLGLIPGVGAIYNAQYAKGLMHVVVMGSLIAILSSSSIPGALYPLVGLILAAWVIYMPFEAYHTAKRRQQGLPVDEFSSIVPLKGGSGRIPVAPLVLIGLGVIFLLNNLDILRVRQILKYWPLFLIALGVYMLYERFGGAPPNRAGGGQ